MKKKTKNQLEALRSQRVTHVLAVKSVHAIVSMVWLRGGARCRAVNIDCLVYMLCAGNLMAQFASTYHHCECATMVLEWQFNFTANTFRWMGRSYLCARHQQQREHQTKINREKETIHVRKKEKKGKKSNGMWMKLNEYCPFSVAVALTWKVKICRSFHLRNSTNDYDC